RVWSFRDVTERIKNQIELVKLSRAVEQNPVSIVITDIKGNIEYVNPKLCEITGYSKDELIGENPRIMSSGERTKEEFKVFWETILSGKEWHGEFHNKKKNGELYWENASVSPIKNDKDEITHFIGIKEDISERKRSEQIQKALFAISSAVVTTGSLEELIEVIQQQIGTIIDTKNFFIAFYDETTGMLSSPFVQDERDNITSWPAEKSLTGHVIKNNKSVLLSKEDILEMNRSGQIDLIGTTAESWLGVPLLIGEKVSGAFVVQNYENRDAYVMKDLVMLEFVASQISQSIRRQNSILELKDALVKAEAGDKLKTNFLNNISHEVRTPLNGILGFAEIMAQPDLPEEYRDECLSMLFESSNRLLDTINNYMDISLITSGNLSVYKKDFFPGDILRKIYDNYKTPCSNRNLELSLGLPEETGSLQVNSDPEILRKIMSHLLNNAIKFTEKGNINFGYGIHQGYLEFFVKDTGIGIGNESIEAVFNHFTKEDAGPLRVTEGSGLGLSITKGMAELLGGKIRVESEKGKGSSFFITIPISKEIKTKVVINKEGTTDKGTSSKAILVAEDDETNFFFLHALLRQYTSSEVIHAKNGKEAVELFNQNPGIGLILMDIKMPVMNGLEATRLIKAVNPDIPVIAITAYAMAGDEARILEAGCDHYLTKPLDKKLLLAKLAESNFYPAR
ncbi:MAG: hypothetical protein C0408_06730, partial [Odoribacter sp.]|nr:hypothetical protein [Odoribacter sp.]